MSGNITGERSMDNTLKRKLQNYFATRPAIRLVVVFGSTAGNGPGVNQDLDLGVAAAAPLGPDERLQLATDLQKTLGIPIDLLDLHTAEGTILTQALSKGAVLVNRDRTLFARLIQKMWYAEEDFAPLYREALARRRTRFFHG